jgi:hypothetical protein
MELNRRLHQARSCGSAKVGLMSRIIGAYSHRRLPD